MIAYYNIIRTLKECNTFYDKGFASEFEQFLSEGKDGSLCSTNKKSSNNLYLQYIEYHLKNKKCPSFCSRLWLVQSFITVSHFVISL